MGPALDALSDVPMLIKHNPIIPVVAWVGAIVSSVLGVVLGVLPGGTLLNFLVVTPVVVAGLLALIYAGRDGTASIGDFVAGVRDHYTTLVGVYVVTFALVMGLTFEFFAVVGVVLGASVFGSALGTGVVGGGMGGGAGGVGGAGGMGGAAGGVGGTTGGVGGATGGLGALAGLGSLFVVLVVLALIVFVIVLAMIFQFVDVAVVVGEESVLGAVGEGWRLFREAPLSVFGFSLVRFVVTVLTVVTPFALAALVGASVGIGDTLSLVFLVLGVLVFFPLSYLFGYTYHVAYYNRVTTSLA